MGATGLSADRNEYRARLAEQTDAQIDAWAAEMMRDTAIRRGVVRVVEDFRRAAGLTEQQFERVFASGGGPPASRRQGRPGPPDRARRDAVGARPRYPGPGARTAGTGSSSTWSRASTSSSTPDDDGAGDRGPGPTGSLGPDRPAVPSPSARLGRLAVAVAAGPPVPVHPRWARRGHGGARRRGRSRHCRDPRPVDDAAPVRDRQLQRHRRCPAGRRSQAAQAHPGRIRPASAARAVAIACAAGGLAARVGRRAGHRPPGSRRARDRRLVRPAGERHRAFVAAVCGRDPAAARLRLVRGDGWAAGHLPRRHPGRRDGRRGPRGGQRDRGHGARRGGGHLVDRRCPRGPPCGRPRDRPARRGRSSWHWPRPWPSVRRRGGSPWSWRRPWCRSVGQSSGGPPPSGTAPACASLPGSSRPRGPGSSRSPGWAPWAPPGARAPGG